MLLFTYPSGEDCHQSLTDVVGDHIAKVLPAFIEEHAPALHKSSEVLHWTQAILAGQVKHPITDEAMIQPGWMLTLWVGPTPHGDVLGISPIMENAYGLSAVYLVEGFLAEALKMFDRDFAENWSGQSSGGLHLVEEDQESTSEFETEQSAGEFLDALDHLTPTQMAEVLGVAKEYEGHPDNPSAQERLTWALNELGLGAKSATAAGEA